uniref:Uncharacterized protein n=1 Tax=Megaselia scalaris TaxID=36166 RepID=T1GZD9_MEGSC
MLSHKISTWCEITVEYGWGKAKYLVNYLCNLHGFSPRRCNIVQLFQHLALNECYQHQQHYLHDIEPDIGYY